MSTSNKAFQQEAVNTRKRIRRIGLAIMLVFLVSLIAVWALVTQPLLSNPDINDSVPAVDSSRLEAHVRMLSETLFPRDHTRPQNLDRVADYIRKEFESAHGVVSDQPYDVGEKTYRNVIALFGPDTKERIVVGAHYDSAGARPGSDDNASGVAGLIELANILGNNTLPMRVELVAFTLEEPPYFNTEKMGSAVHARSLKQQGVEVRVMFSLEMIGCFSDAPDSQHFPTSIIKPFYPSRGNFITIISKFGQGGIVRSVKRAMRSASSLPVYSINAPRLVPGIDYSDHLNYWRAGYDALMISDTAFYRNNRYHTMQDTPDTLDYNRMAMVVQGVYLAVLAMGQE